MRRFICLIALLLTMLPAPALAQEGVTVVHEEVVAVGPYTVTVGFSRWPLHAERSLDIIFVPDGGIAGRSGSLTLVTPTGDEETLPLTRHPRMRSAWGLDVVALPDEGPWGLVFTIDGAEGRGVGRLAPLTLGARPGPPAALSWAIGLLPALGMLALVAVAWWRVRPGRRADTWRWQAGAEE